MKVAETTKVARLLRPGDRVKVQTPIGEVTEVIRDLTVNILLAGGGISSVNIRDLVTVVEVEDEEEITEAAAVAEEDLPAP